MTYDVRMMACDVCAAMVARDGEVRVVRRNVQAMTFDVRVMPCVDVLTGEVRAMTCEVRHASVLPDSIDQSSQLVG